MKSNLWFFSIVALFSLMPVSGRADEQTIQQALAQAYQTNPELQAARAKLRAVDEQVSVAMSNWRPSIDATANVGKSYTDIPAGQQPSIVSGDFNQTPRSFGAQITQPLFRGFRTEASVHAAEAQVLVARAQLQDTEQRLLFDTGTVFLDVVRDQAVLDLDRSNEDVLQHRFDETQDRYHAGEVTQTDISQADSRLERAHAERIQEDGALATDRVTYARLVGDLPPQLQAPNLILDHPQSLEDAVHLAETRNPNVVAAQYTEQESRADIDLNKGSLLPELDLIGSVSRNWEPNVLIPGREDASQLMVQMTVPLYRAGADYARTRAAEQTVTQHRLELEDARRRAHEEAINAWQALITARAALDADKAQAKSATLALEGVREESKAGTRTTLDVLNAEQELLDAKVSLVRAARDEGVAILQIKAAVGELTAKDLKLPVAAYDPTRHYDDVRNKWLGFGDTDDK